MNAMEIFERCRSSEGDILRIRNRIAQRRDAIESITARMDCTGGGGGSDMDKIGAFVAALDTLTHDLEKREMARNVEIAAAFSLLDGLPEAESNVIHAYYVRRQNPKTIAKKWVIRSVTSGRLSAAEKRFWKKFQRKLCLKRFLDGISANVHKLRPNN